MSEPRSNTTEERLSDAQWAERYDARFRERAGYEGSYSAATGFSGPGIAELREDFDDDPEGAADEEMSYWDDDGDV